jgi:hypothetical protein
VTPDHFNIAKHASTRHSIGALPAQLRSRTSAWVDAQQYLASQKVILAAGGTLHERFNKPPQFGNKPCLRFRIVLDQDLFTRSLPNP